MNRSTKTTLCLVLIILSAAITCHTGALAADPPPPPGGFPIIEDLDIPLTYTDGYEVRIDVRYPDASPGPDGWPMIVFVHGFASSKDAFVVPPAQHYASLGYVTVTYDVRGQGSSMGLNDPQSYGLTFYYIRERVDLAEILEGAEDRYPDLVDFDRLGVSGASQGGVHSFIAAAHSGQALPQNPWRTEPFPVISCAAPRNMLPYLKESTLPEKRNLHHITLTQHVALSGVHFDPDYLAFIMPIIVAEDYEFLAAYVESPEVAPWDLVPHLQESDVPLLLTLAFDDRARHPTLAADLWDVLKPTTPRRLFLATGGHGTPHNFHEENVYDLLHQRWFERFLKGVENGVDQEPPIRSVVTPDDTVYYDHPLSLWDFRELESLDPQAGLTETWYLDGDNRLSPAPPTAAGVDDLKHEVLYGFDIEEYINWLPTLDLLLAEYLEQLIPPVSLAYDAPAAAEDVHIFGTPRAHLYTETDDTRYLVHAALFDVAPGGEERYITGGWTTVRDNLPPGEHELSIALGTCSHVLRQGHALRARVENWCWHRPPSEAEIVRILPVFEESLVGVKRDSLHASRIELPLLPFEEPRLVAAPIALSAAAPEIVRIAVHTDSSQANRSYQILPGISGTSPGFEHQGVHIPINYDSVTKWALRSPNSSPFVDFAGDLDDQGFAYALLLLDKLGPLSYSGPLDFVVVVEGDNGLLVSEPCGVAIEP